MLSKAHLLLDSFMTFKIDRGGQGPVVSLIVCILVVRRYLVEAACEVG